MRREVPEPWASAMLAQGFEYAKRPSLRALARGAGIPSVETVRGVVYGETRPEVETVDALARALKQPRRRIGEWVGQARASEKPFDVPPEVALLTLEEQQAVQELIRAIARPRRAMLHLAAGSGKSAALAAVIAQTQSLRPDERDRLVATLASRTELPALEDEPDGGQGLAEAAYHSPEPAGQPQGDQP